MTTDHAAVVREQLRHLGPQRGAVGEAALDALVAERDEALRELKAIEAALAATQGASHE